MYLINSFDMNSVYFSAYLHVVCCSIHLVVFVLVGSLGLLLDHVHLTASSLSLHVDLVQTIHYVLVAIRLLQSLFAIRLTAFRVLISIILRNPLRTRLPILNVNSIHYLLFDHIEDPRNDRCLELFGVNFCLLDVFTAQYQLESVLHLGFCSTFYDVGNLSPFIAKFEPLLKEFLVFTEGPLTFLDGRIKCCEPSFAALLAVPRDEGHFVAILVCCTLNDLYQGVIELLGDT